MRDEDLRDLLERFRDDILARVDAVGVRVDALDTRVQSLDTRVGELSARVETLGARVDAVEDRITVSETRMLARLDAAAAEMRLHFETTAERMDRRFDRVAEALALVDWKIETRTVGLDERMTQGFADLDATIRFSHAHLVTRIERLEVSRG